MNKESTWADKRVAGGGGRYFVTTQWTVVLNARDPDAPEAKDALESLCRGYWYPLYAYVRRRGYSAEDAQDLTQAFFARLLEKESLKGITRAGGKFRSFLLTALNHFLADEWKKVRAQKRGADRVISLDAAEAEQLFGAERSDLVTPEKLYERNWALTLLDSVFQRLKKEYDSAGKSALFAQLKFCLAGERSAVPYGDLARALAVPENTVKTLVHRLRARYRELLREEVGRTVPTAQEIEEELRSLFRALAS